MKKTRTFIAFLMTLIMGLSGISLDGFAALSYAAEDQEAPAVTQEQGVEETEAAQPDETEAEAAEAAEEEITEDTGTEPDSDDAAAPDEAGLDGVTPDTDQEEPEEAKATNLEQTITVSDKKTYKVSVTYDEQAGIPADAELRVAEVSDKDYKTYLQEAAETLDTDLHSLSYGKLFDISIVKDGKEYQPNEKVAVKINLIDKDAEAVKDVKVVHFSDSDRNQSADSDLGTPEELKASTKGTTVTFKTDSFSVFSFMDFSLKNQTIDASVEGKKGTQFKNDDIIVTGKMPANGIVEANRVNAKIGKENVLVAYDIKIYANDLMKELNINWQPGEEAVKVKMTSDALNVEKVNVYHTPDGSKEAELVAKNVSVKKHSVTFDAESFSIYHVTGETTKPRIFYTFYNGSTTLATEYITKIEDFYDPGVSPQYGQTFLGWAFDPAETDESKMLSFEQLKADLETRLAGTFEDETEVKVYARFHEAYYLRYMVMEGDGTVGVLKSESVRTDASESEKTKTVDCEYSVAGEEFQGWIDAASGHIYQNGDPIMLNHHIDLYAKVSGRYWLVFNANTTGATFTGPQLIYGNIKTQQPDNPTKKGYLFRGWNTKSDGTGDWWYKPDGSVNRFGGLIDEDTTLYAIWEGAPSNYTVAFWQQKLNTSGTNKATDYDYVTSETRASITGNTVSITAADKAKVLDPSDSNYANHFVYNSGNSDEDAVTVEGDGSTVLNVYYDRKEYTLRFFYAREYTYDMPATIDYEYTQVGTANNGRPQGFTRNNSTTYYTESHEALSWTSGGRCYTGYNYYTGNVYTRRQVTIPGGTHKYIQVNSNNEGFLQWRNSNPDRTLEQALTWRTTNDYTNTGGSNTWKDVNTSTINGNPLNLITSSYLSQDGVSTGSIVINNVATDVCISSVESSEKRVNMIYHYIDVKARYRQSLASLWPSPATAFSTQTETRYNRQGPLDQISALLQGSRASADNISGVYSTMDDALLVNRTDDIAYFLTYWRWHDDPPKYYLYRTYFSVLDGERADITINGVGYKLQEDKTAVIGNGVGWATSGADTDNGRGYKDVKTVSFDGVTRVSRVDEQTGGTWDGQSYEGRINVYYKRNPHTIHFVTPAANTKYSADNDHQVQNIVWGENLSSYAPGKSNYYETPANMIDDGYFFGGWYDDKSCTIPHDFNGQTMPDADVTVYAKIDTYRVRVVFEPNCSDYWFANEQALSFRVNYGENIAFGNVKPDVAKRPGYKLTGWYYTPDFQAGSVVDTDESLQITNNTPGVNMDYQSTDDWANNVYGDNDGKNDNVKGILKLYARWQLDIKEGAVYFLYEVEDGYCIFDASNNNQTSIPVDPVGHVMETSFQIADAPTGYIEGVDFTNWMLLNKSGGATSIVYNPGDTITLHESEWNDYIETITVTDSEGHVGTMNVVRLRARFTAKEDKATTIVFDGNGGSMSGGATTFTQVVPLNATIDLETQSAAFTREHYTLVSWNTKADGSGDSFDLDEDIYANNDGLEPGEPNRLYAMWQADIEIVATGPEEEAIYDGESHSNQEPYTFKYLLGGEEITLNELQEMGIDVTIAERGWPVATGTERGVYTADDLTAEELAGLIQIDDSNYTGIRNIKRVYHPAKLTIRDLKLTMTKTVTGDFSDPKDVFHFKLQSVEGVDSSTTFKGTITHEGTTSPKIFKIGQDSTFWLRDGDSVEIEGLPKGKEVTIVENSGFYTPTWVLNDETVTGSDPDEVKVILSGDSTLEVTNNLPAVAPTAVTQRFMPYICMGLLALMLLAVMVMGRRRRSWAADGMDADAFEETETAEPGEKIQITFEDFDWDHIKIIK